METLDPTFLPRADDYMSVEVAWIVDTSVDLFTDVVTGQDYATIDHPGLVFVVDPSDLSVNVGFLFNTACVATHQTRLALKIDPSVDTSPNVGLLFNTVWLLIN